MSTLTDLIKTITQGQYFSDIMARHKANGVPVDAWLDTLNTGLSLSQIDAQLLADLRQSVSNMAAAMFLDYASGDGLTLFAKSQYGIDRAGAQYTQGKVRLVSQGGSPVYNIIPGQITIGTQGDTAKQKLYTNISGGILNASSYVDLDFRAMEPGSAYNISNNTAMDMKTSLAGVTVSSPDIYPLGLWKTQIGIDAEPDDKLKERCRARWGTIGAECNEEAMIYFALLPPAGYTASPVKYVRVMSDWLQMQYWPGAVTVVVGSDAGTLPIIDLNAVRANYENPQKYGIGRVLDVVNMNLKLVGITATVNVFSSSGASLTDIQAKVEASLADYETLLGIGEVLAPQKIGARMEDADKSAIRDVVLSSPNVMVEPLFYEKVKFDLSPMMSNITYTYVAG